MVAVYAFTGRTALRRADEHSGGSAASSGRDPGPRRVRRISKTTVRRSIVVGRASQRTLLAPERVARPRPHFQCRCGNPDCRAELPKTPAGDPLSEQMIQVPKIVPSMTEDPAPCEHRS